MLKTYINAVPNTKFILLTDSLEHRDAKLFDYILNQRLVQNHKIDYCTFEGVYQRAKSKFKNHLQVSLHNFVSNTDNSQTFDQFSSSISTSTLVVIDSLANTILQCGLPVTIRSLNDLIRNKAVIQVIGVLHKDLLPSHLQDATLYLKSLSTLNIDVQPKFMTDSLRLCYEYKKSGGKVIREIEEYLFERDILVTKKVVKPEPSKLLEKSTAEPVNPEELSSFRIGLTDEEKLSRDKVVLPYLPNAKEESQIFYQLDEVDDWDEEDPDDDLDI